MSDAGMRAMSRNHITRTSPAPAFAGMRAMPQGVYRGARARSAPDPHALAKRYTEGRTLRQIAAEIGCCHATVINRLRTLKRYPATVTKVLRMRTERAFRDLSIAPARTYEAERRAKLAAFIFERERPARFRQWLRRGLSRLPGVGEIRRIGVVYHARADCPECGDRGRVEVRGIPGAWSWWCSSCDAGQGEAARPKRGRRP